MQELAQVFDLFEILLRGHRENPRDIVQHVRPHHDARFDLHRQIEVRCLEQTLQRLPGRTGLTSLDARDDGLGGTGPAREGALAETGASTGLKEQCGSGGHGQ